MTQTISRQKKPLTPNYEEDNWDDIEFPETGLLLINNNNDYGLSTTTRDMSGITINDSSDGETESEEEYFGKVTNYNSNKSTPASSSSSSTSSINKVKEMMINSGVVVTNNKKEFSGLITRIGGENNKVIAVGDDWGNDMEIPEDGFANFSITNNKKNRSRSSTTVTNDFEFDSWDEEEQNITTKNSITSPRGLIIKRIEDPSKVLSKSNIAPSKALESFDDDFDFSEVDLKLSAEALKLYEKVGNLNDKDPFESERYSSRNSSRLSILQSPAPTNSSQSAVESGEEEEDLFDDIQFPEHMDSLTLISYNDDDNFENGLDIDDESVFAPDKLKNKNIITRPNPTQQKRTRRESFTIEFTTSPKNSRSSTPSISLSKNKVHPKTADNNNYSPVSSPHRLKTNKVLSKSLGSLKTSTTTAKNTSKSTFPKNPVSPKSPKIPVKEVVKKNPISLTNARSKSTTNKSSSKKIVTNNSCTKSTLKTNQMPNKNRKRSQQNINPKNTPKITPNANPNTISTLEVMRKPKSQHCFGDGSELDGFDDLPISIDRERSYVASNYTRHDRRKNSVSSVGSSDNLQRHRKHKKNRKKKKPQLIRNLNLDKNPKVVGEMVYNPITQRWDGNDSVLKDFDNVLTSPTRPALITNMNNHTINTKSFQVVGKMKFDPIKMCWNKNNDSSDDDEIWAKFDYDDPTQEFSDNDTSIRKKNDDFQVGSEFDITPGFLAALLASERQHRNEITKWYPDALSKKNCSRFGLKDVTLQRSYLYDLRNKNNRGNATNNSPPPSSGNNSKVYHNRSGGLFEAAMNLTRHERRHFR